ncbi:MAG: carbonic anhydrase [Rhodothermales bacterium]|nr:carbonic anhydrase [Rhodothermales bacterium]
MTNDPHKKHEPPHTGPLTAESQATLSPSEALGWLVAGNDRFVREITLDRDHAAAVRATAVQQFPFAVVLGCMDSRVAPEIIFDAGIGDIFSVRVAGNYASPGALGSLEFATLVAGAKIILVLGHSGCGAVAGAVQGGAEGNLGKLLEHIAPAIDAVEDFTGNRDASNPIFTHAVARENVKMTIDQIMTESPAIAAAVREGRIGIAGAMHDVSSGAVNFFDRR